MKKENVLSYDHSYLDTWYQFARFGILGDVIRQIRPDRAEQLVGISDKFLELQQLDINETDNKPQTDYILPVSNVYTNSNKKLFWKQSQVDDLYDAMNQFKGILEEVKNDPKMAEYPELKAFCGYYSKLGDMILDGRDFNEYYFSSLVGRATAGAQMDFVLKKKGSDREYTLKEFDTFLSDFHYNKMADLSIDVMESLYRLDDPSIKKEEKDYWADKYKKAALDYAAESEYLMRDDTVEKISPFMVNIKDDVLGGRGFYRVAGLPSREMAGALERGWDPSYIRDYPMLKHIIQDYKRTDELLELVGNSSVLSDARDKANKLAEFDPEGRTFNSKAEFIKYYDDTGRAMKDLLSEIEKPEVQAEISKIKANPNVKGVFNGHLFLSGANIKEQYADQLSMNIVVARFDYYANRVGLSEKGINASNLTDGTIDYTFMLAAASELAGKFDAGFLGAYRKEVGEKWFSEENFNSHVVNPVSHLETNGFNGPKMINPYLNGIEYKQLANSVEQKNDTAADLEMISGEYKELLANPELQKFPGATSHLKYLQRFVESAREGVDRYKYMTMMPGGSRSLALADWKTKGFTSQEFDDMLTGMKFDQLWEKLDARCDLEMEMAGKDLSPEQRAEYSQKLVDVNKDLIGIYEHMMSPECEKKYSRFYENFSLNITGARGYGGSVRGLNAENEALAKGWDPAKISDMRMMAYITERCRNTKAIFNAMDDPAINRFADSVKRVANLDPSYMGFESQADFENYYMDFSLAVKDMMAEGAKPGILDSIDGFLKANKGLVDKGKTVLNGIDPNMGDHERFVFFANKTDLANDPIARSPERQAYIDKIRDRAEYRLSEKRNALDADHCVEGLEKIQKQAQEKLRDFTTNLDGLQKKNSDYYNNMRSALEAVADLSSWNSLNEINAALDNLSKRSQEYTKARDGIFKSDAGRKRLNAAADLTDFAKNAKDTIGMLSKDTILAKKSSDSVHIFVSSKGENVDMEALDNELKGWTAFTEKIVNQSQSMAEDIEQALAPENDRSYTVKDWRGENKLNGLERYNAEYYTELKGFAGLEFHEDENVIDNLAKVIVGKTLSIQVKKGAISEKEAVSKYADSVSSLRKDGTFREWSKQYTSKDKNCEENLSDLCKMTPGEIYTKFTVAKHNEMLKKDAAKQMDRKKELEQMLHRKSAPKAPGM